MERSATYIAVPPGETIREQLNYRGMSQKEFAARMGLSEKHVSRLINGEVILTVDVAVRLETVLGIPASFWTRLEAMYRETLIKVLHENSLIKDMEIANMFPYDEMAEMGWIPEAEKEQDRVENLRSYFEIVSLALLGKTQITKIACRRLDLKEANDLALLAWVQRARIIARGLEIDQTDMRRLKKDIPRISDMILAGNWYENMTDLLGNFGVALVFIPRIEGAHVDGAAFLDGKRIVIGIMDDDKVDGGKALLHELGHVLLGHLKNPGDLTENDERAADRWAEEKLCI